MVYNQPSDAGGGTSLDETSSESTKQIPPSRYLSHRARTPLFNATNSWREQSRLVEILKTQENSGKFRTGAVNSDYHQGARNQCLG